MPTALPKSDIQRLARLGAIARLKELEEEAKAIRRMFRGLRIETSKEKKEAESGPTPSPKKARRKKRSMSPEAREAARERMKAYWAKRKAGRK